MPLPSVFEICTPRGDVLSGTVSETSFAADLSQVLKGTAPEEYLDPTRFFANTHPTVGLKALLQNVCQRLRGTGEEAGSIFRLDTQYGGGKTHALIALAHTVRGMPGVANVEEFISRDLLPTQAVRLAVFDGENADPANGRDMGSGIRAFTPWGEIAAQLAGPEGFARVQASDETGIAPGAETLRELFGGEPTLILLDELSIYLSKVFKNKQKQDQLPVFLTSLFKAIEGTPNCALVFTLAVNREGKGTDAYAEENTFINNRIAEAESISARKATLLDPTSENETAQVLRRRLFLSVDFGAADPVVEEYARLWHDHREILPPVRMGEDLKERFRESYPLHPDLVAVLTDKVSTLGNFQRVRGMLRLLAATVSQLWSESRDPETFAVHAHHVDPGNEKIKNEFMTRLQMGNYDQARRLDVSAPPGQVSIAQEIDREYYGGLKPYASFVARTAFLHTFAFNDQIKGIGDLELRRSVLSPTMEVAYIDDGRKRFIEKAGYLDDRPNVPLRFLSEANLRQHIRHEESRVDPDRVRTEINDRIKGIFTSQTFEIVPFPSGAYEVDDTAGQRPRLVVLGYDAVAISGDEIRVPDLVGRIFQYAGSGEKGFRSLRNHLVFVVANETAREKMKEKMRRRLALFELQRPDRLRDYQPHQQEEIKSLYQKSETEIATAIQQCYRHIFFPTRNRCAGTDLDLGHASVELSSAGEQPGKGQAQIVRSLRDANKLRFPDDPSDSPSYMRDKTKLRTGSISVAELRDEYRRNPELAILQGDDILIRGIRKGIEDGLFVYQSGTLLCGKGDPPAAIKFDENSFIFTMDEATQKGIWPRPEVKPTQAGPPAGGGPTSPSPEGDKPVPGSSSPGTPASPTPVGQLQAEGPVREVLARIFEQATTRKIKTLKRMTFKLFDSSDGFKFLGAIMAIPDAVKRVDPLEVMYEAKDGSSFESVFTGSLEEMKFVKDFLDPQIRAAKETSFKVCYEVVFNQGLQINQESTTAFTERCARFASGSVYIEASAE